MCLVRVFYYFSTYMLFMVKQFLHKTILAAACLYGLPFGPEQGVVHSSGKSVYFHQTTRHHVQKTNSFRDEEIYRIV